MKFKVGNFFCDVEVYRNGNDLIARFYDKSKEQEEEDLSDLVIVDPGYGYINLKVKGEGGIMSGYLDETVFSSDDMIERTIEFVEELVPELYGVGIYHHIRKVKFTGYVEYNGEY